jgi:hypothetical protein
MRSPGIAVYIDAYNVILRHAPWRRLSLAARRAQLAALAAMARWPAPVERVVLVFDGPDAGGPGRAHRHGGVEMRFASPSADAYLQETIRASVHPERLLLITDDAEILRTARSHGVRFHSAAWLLGRAAPAHSTSEPAAGRAELPAAAARRITEELAKRWLKP